VRIEVTARLTGGGGVVREHIHVEAGFFKMTAEDQLTDVEEALAKKFDKAVGVVSFVVTPR
jgi:hypothetical protein